MVEAKTSQAKIMWLGHAGFKVTFMHEGVERVVYIDPWFGNPKYPESLKDEAGGAPIPTDADLVLITHGHFDHASHADAVQKASTKPCKIAASFELCNFYKLNKGVAEDGVVAGNICGTIDLEWCKITMVHAVHSSSCGFSEDGISHYAGPASGWVLRLDNGVSVYHAGDTGVFTDMNIINELYTPTHLCLPIGGNFTMGPEEAAYGVAKFLTNASVVIPMHFLTFPLLKGDLPAFKSELDKRGVTGKQIVDSYADLLGKWMDLTV
uniref:Uncharacterized protein n=1 Tax=Favella ehrenbergii TaxID=182087 RepID=A0A7S3I8E2_9SPIT|eukprot:Macronucleus_1776.p1 GENE.Macronucleus_1776~~Macronucleus_1776.p1  ORF type:complete len:266 (+),score=72.19 Macronucleus_1776:1-798(+)